MSSLPNHTVQLSTALLAVSAAFAGAPRFPEFEVTSREDPKVTFLFSAADATTASPVVISVPARKLTDGEGKHRVSLQKYWLSINVPKDLKFLIRTLDNCEFKRKDEQPICDHYVFEDPATKQRFDYYIYVGNWP
jgi:hypothetical protein